MRIVRLVFFVLAAAAMTLLAGAAQAAMKTQWIDYKQGKHGAVRLISSMTTVSKAGAPVC